MENTYRTKWLDSKLTIATPFGGGKFGDTEEIISLENNIVTTNLFEFDKVIGCHREMAIIEKHRYEKKNFVEIERE